MVSFLIQEIKRICDAQLPSSTTSIYYYCFHAHNQDEAKPFLRWILSQLLRKAGRVPKTVYDLHQERVEPTLESILDALEAVLSYFDKVFITIDAVDESQSRGNLLGILSELSGAPRFNKLCLLVTSREYIDIERVMAPISRSMSMSNPLVEQDIRHYVSQKMKSTTYFQRFPSSLREEIENTLSKGARGMFRWAVCQLDILRRLSTLSSVRLALGNLPDTLDETYRRIFLDISKDDWPLLRHTLRIICSHERFYDDRISANLIISSYCPAFRDEYASQADHFYTTDSLKEICGCLITFTTDPSAEIRTATLAHYTVREYLESSRILSGPTRYFALQQDADDAGFLQSVFRVAENARFHGCPAAISDGDDDPYAYDDDGPHPAHPWIFQSNLDHYCLWTAVSSLYKNPNLHHSEDFEAAAIHFLDPMSPNFRQRRVDIEALFHPRHHRGSEANFIRRDKRKFWNLRWAFVPSDPRIAVLFELLWIGPGCRGLASKLSATIDPQSLVETCLSLTATEWDRVTEKHGTFELHGDITTVLAQAGRLMFSRSEALELVWTDKVASFNPTTALMSYIIAHDHITEFGRPCIVDWMLALGANPNPEGVRVSPLQVAVACLDYPGVASLLQKGADPNGIGDANGSEWGEKSLGRHFRDLHGYSPLHIIRNTTRFASFSAMGGEMLRWRGKSKELIERILLRYEARLLALT